ncbi:hypothetical protein KC19_10G146700 [Ceratodon purpureus]|uniref:E3 ubiquitin-protein ligase n=1 Tax=Ceratodon purpureus TaxID=3225 RepID=A0A8T0GND2_CERPU|nr:hypothetical protein KC19_10G146700 [Ceratodon purpureus]
MTELQPSHVSEEGAKIHLGQLNLKMSGGKELDAYLDEFRAQGESQCTNVWSKGIIAYRCRTCQTNDSSAICVDCFQNGNHWEHDYVMYHSESGGCCDCGDRAAWKESGFCSTHQRLNVPEVKVNDELLVATHGAVQHVLRELLAWVKKLNEKLSVHQSPSEQETEKEVAMARLYLDWSLKVCAVDALRSIVCKDIIEYVGYQADTSTSPLDILLDCLGWMPERIIEAETTLFLQLLYKNEFKTQFLNLLKGKYEKMIMLALSNQAYLKNYKYLDTNLDRVMVQLFNDPEMTTHLIHEYNLLELFIGVFSKVITCSTEGEPAVVNVEHEAISCKVYLRPQGDLRLIVSHGDIAIHMLSKQPHLFPHLLDVLVKLQWINPYFRGDDDTEFENSWTLAIQLEMNSMAIIFQLIARCYHNPLVAKTTLVTAATFTLKALNLYLEQARRISEQEESSSLSKSVSLHIPLHRTLSAILQKLVLLPWDNHERGFLSALLPQGKLERDIFTKDEVLRLMEHPLRILVWMAQIRAQMWRKTSEEFSRLELIYRGSFWHDQSMDMDILLIQFCTVALENLQETIFIKIAEQFDFKMMATTRSSPKRDRRQSEIALLQDFMRLVLLIVRERRNLGRTDLEEAQDKCLQYDVIQWLCVRDQTYSQLCRALSAIPMDHHKLNAMLDKVAIYHEPKVADRGYYQLKPEYWREFDPLFAHYYLNELEDAEDRAVKVGKLEHYWRIKAPPAAGAPYDRLSSLLHTKACHLFLLNVLDEVRCLVKENVTATAGEALGVTALQMLAVLVSDSRENMRNGAAKTYLSHGPQDAFPTEDIAVNIHVPIRKDSCNRGSESVSIHEMLRDLVGANHCTRLVDSVNHVLELLCLSSNEKTHAAESDSQGGEDLQRRLLKEQRQKAILADFAAKRNAFMEHQDVSDDDEDSEEGSEEGSRMEGSCTVDETYAHNRCAESTTETLTKAVMPVAETDYIVMETSSEIKECVLCRRRRDDRNSSMCWVALVQRYNFPCQVLNRGEPVSNISDVDPAPMFGQFHEGNIANEGLDQLVTVGFPDDSRVATAIDFSTVEHVQCCGHQMHFDCFHGHMKNLQLNRNGGNGVVDPSKAEFACPTCRRLANVLLPDVDASLSSKRHEIVEDGKDLEETGKFWSRFWQSNKNLEHALHYFCSQVLRVQLQLPQSFFSLGKFELSQALWEGLILNVIHCEVETRDRYVKGESASSSSAPIRLSDECTWGGDGAHWIALRELGRLAMLSNTLPGAVRRKNQMCRSLRECLGLHGTPKSDIGSESSSDLARISELEGIIQEIFPQNSFDSEETEPLDSAEMASDPQDCQAEGINLQENLDSTPMPCMVSVQEREKELAITSADPNYSMVLEESKDSNFADSKHGGLHPSGLAAPDPVAPDPQQKYEITYEDAAVENEHREKTTIDSCPSQLSPPEQKQENSRVIQEKRSTWIPDILKNGVLTADPSRLLTLLLIICIGQPDKRSLHSMVKFAYTAAVLQAEIAVIELGGEGPMVENLVQRACLPFLRRAAMLVQIITREDFRGHHGLSGAKVMEFTSLQRALQLPDCTRILQRQPGERVTLATELLVLHQPVSKAFTFELRKVPPKATLLHKLPRVFQELLLENIHNKKQCSSCGEMPADPAICLICGMLLCCGTDCCRSPAGVGECSQHAADESAGVGIFLLLRSTQLLLLRNNRTCMGLSLYLDIHGEPAQEDLYLRRSQLLYLSELRLKEVRRLWMTAAFDYDSYILRNSQSKPIQY